MDGFQIGTVRSNLVWGDRMSVFLEKADCSKEPILFMTLSTANLKDVLTSKVVAGRITSIASKISGTLLGRGSANNLPPSLRGTLSGRFTQIGSAFKSGFAGATKAIGSFFSGFKFSDRRLKEEIQFKQKMIKSLTKKKGKK